LKFIARKKRDKNTKKSEKEIQNALFFLKKNGY